ncbi:hypothetical protein Dsin_026500 [Dipteronia sinensis]|uniref:Transmembrane protein n=1 Tax=Dipteronia sinensis TaxID=43782 RepID=A0AAD9ZY17_9ROSI|nr:hypothetical protein Dsin_026500 [Dipteronia sinensis]
MAMRTCWQRKVPAGKGTCLVGEISEVFVGFVSASLALFFWVSSEFFLLFVLALAMFLSVCKVSDSRFFCCCFDVLFSGAFFGCGLLFPLFGEGSVFSATCALIYIDCSSKKIIAPSLLPFPMSPLS